MEAEIVSKGVTLKTLQSILVDIILANNPEDFVD